jgi:[ribosomal protein S5]-alanine N-acetyltransferase
LIATQHPNLILRPFAIQDAAGLFALNADPEVLKYTGDSPFANVESATEFIRSYDAYTRWGYGRWAMILKESDQFIGWCGLRFSEQTQETDLGFRLVRSHWGKGLATAAANASVKYGFQQLRLPQIVGRAMKENQASIRVLEKCGMQFWKEFIFEEHPGVYYQISNSGE